MDEVLDIQTASIDPDSTVNVRKSQIEESVEKVKASIEQHGFWRTCPIIVRPHPDSSSQFQYEVVIGQCRLKACLELGHETIPAVEQEIDDDAAIRQSWAENEGRSNLTKSDKAYWVHRMVLRYTKEGKSLAESRDIVANFFGMSPQSVMNYDPLVALPEEVAKRMDDASLKVQDAIAIAKFSHYPVAPERSREIMKERADWIMTLGTDDSKRARKALKQLGPAASIDDLQKAVHQSSTTESGTVEVAIPQALHGKLIEWGNERGLTDEATIIAHMIAETLRSV